MISTCKRRVRRKCTGQISLKVGLVLRVIRQPAAVSPFSVCLSWCLPQGSGCLRWSMVGSKGLAVLFTCSRALQGLSWGFSRDCVAIQLLSLLHPASFPSTHCHSHPATESLLCVCFWKTSLRQGAYRSDLQAIMSSPSFSLKTSQQIVQPAQSSGGVNNGKRDIYPCLLPGSTFSLPCRKGSCVFSFFTSYLQSDDYCRFSLFCILF